MTLPAAERSRQFLFLQGLPGDFFKALADALAAEGHGVHRVNFNGGDVFAWGRSGAVNFRGSPRDWPVFLVRLLAERAITDVVLFGDCRPLHRTARATAAGLGLAVHVFEEGYVRPDWITLERGGVNGFSPMPDDPDWYVQTAATLKPISEAPALPSAFTARARATVAYYTGAVLLAFAFPSHKTHRPWHPLLEALGWGMRLGRRSAATRRSDIQLGRLKTAPYFVLPLQLDSDYQLRVHSDFDGMQPAVARILASFARHAPADAVLVVKEHPLDNGLVNWRRQTLHYAQALGMSERVIYLEVADISLLVRAAKGVATVNSTTGTLALAAGVPVATLGRAIYDVPGLTHQGSLDDFWRAPEPPDLALYEAFRCVLAHRCLLRGGFYDKATRPALIDAAIARMTSAELPAISVASMSAHIDAFGSTLPPTISRRRRATGPRALAPLSPVHAPADHPAAVSTA